MTTDLETIGTIKHNDMPDVRVTLYADDAGNVWAAAPGEQPYSTGTRVDRIAQTWGGPEWDLCRADDVLGALQSDALTREQAAIASGRPWIIEWRNRPPMWSRYLGVADGALGIAYKTHGDATRAMRRMTGEAIARTDEVHGPEHHAAVSADYVGRLRVIRLG